MGAALPKPSLDAVDEDVLDSLINSMSLDEKLGQMWQVDWRILRPRPMLGMLGRMIEVLVNLVPGCSAERPLRDKDCAEVTNLALGSVLGGGGAFPVPNTSENWAEQEDALQRAADATPTGVPLLIGNDTVHGQVHLKGATIFPHHIGLGCTRDVELVERLAMLAARESAACGINWIFAPCATVPRDLRWGRTYEGFSEDPRLVGELSAAEVRGLQGAGVPMAACVKHWVADGGTALGSGTGDFVWTGAPPHVLDQGDAQCDEKAGGPTPPPLCFLHCVRLPLALLCRLPSLPPPRRQAPTPARRVRRPRPPFRSCARCT